MQVDTSVECITILPSAIPRRGASSSIYPGFFGRREVAIKRFSNWPESCERREAVIDLFIKADEYPGILRYFASSCTTHYHYIALEKCQMNLAEYSRNEAVRSEVNPREVSLQLLIGLEGLHRLSYGELISLVMAVLKVDFLSF
jgi:hypothetical protein